GTWRPGAVFAFIAEHGGIGQDEMERVFNMGVGMAAVVSAADAARALDLLTARGIPAWRAGQVTSGVDVVRLVGAYRAGGSAYRQPGSRPNACCQATHPCQSEGLKAMLTRKLGRPTVTGDRGGSGGSGPRANTAVQGVDDRRSSSSLRRLGPWGFRGFGP